MNLIFSAVIQIACQALLAKSAASVVGSRNKVVPRITGSVATPRNSSLYEEFHARTYFVEFFYMLNDRKES